MSEVAPQYFRWDAERSVMEPRLKRLADKTYVDGEEYRLGPIEERSLASHNAYFAAVHEAFLNLPEDMSDRFMTEDHLRRYCLIKAGFADERSIVCASKADALRVQAFIKPMDTYALVTAVERVVTVYTAKSQSFKAMGKKDFQASKEAVLEVLAAMVGVKPESLSANAGASA